MKSFLVLFGDKQLDLFNTELLNSHINYLKQLHQTGHLQTCGPFANDDGAMLIIKASSQEQVENLVAQDPFIKENYYQRISIQEYTEANAANNWLAAGEIEIDPTIPTQTQSIEGPPKSLAVLHRKFKDGKTYDDFRQAWLPPVDNPLDKESLANYFHLPVKVISAVNAFDPTDIISIALIWADSETIQAESHRAAATEAIRRERVAEVSDKTLDPKMYTIMDIDVLGK
jgi:uncharacterized protein YciI